MYLQNFKSVFIRSVLQVFDQDGKGCIDDRKSSTCALAQVLALALSQSSHPITLVPDHNGEVDYILMDMMVDQCSPP